MYLQTLDFIVLGVYFVGLFLLGVFFSDQRESDDYFLAGRSVSSLLAGISVFATLFSTVSYLSLPGEMIRNGIGYFSSLLAFVFIIPTVNYLIIPALMRLPVTSVYDYLERRYSKGVRLLGAWVFVAIRLVWMGLILYTAARAIRPMTDWNLPLLVTMMGIVTIFYTALGGMHAVIWSDFAQFVILFGGAVLVPCLIAIRTAAGPFQWWSAFAQVERAEVPLFSPDPTQRTTIIGMMLTLYVWNICTHGSDQVAAQRYLSTPSAATARRSFVAFFVANVGVLSLLMVVGLALFYFRFQNAGLPANDFHQTIVAQADDVFPEFLATQLPAGAAGLMLAALLAAAMSSLSSGINSISAVVVTDLLSSSGATSTRPESSNVPRVMAVLSGLVAIVGAVAIDQLMQATHWNLVDLIERINMLFVAPLGALFFAGILFRHVGASAAIIGFACGIVVSLLISFSQWLFDYPISFMWIMPGSFLVSMFVAWCLGFCFARPTPSQLSVLYWGTASRRSE